MAKWRCSLCGGKLSEGRCILCGLDNTIYKRETAYSGGASQEEGRQKQKQHIKALHQIRRPDRYVRKEISEAGKYNAAASSAGGSGYAAGRAGQRSTAASAQQSKQQSYSAGRAVRPANNRKTKSGRLTIIVILLIIMFSFLPTIIEVVQTVIQDISSDSGFCQRVL